MREPGGITKSRIRPANLPKYFMIGLVKCATKDVGYRCDLEVEMRFDIAMRTMWKAFAFGMMDATLRGCMIN